MREPTAEIRQTPAATVRASPVASFGAALAGRLHRQVGTEWLRTYLIAVGIAALLCLTGANGTDAFPLARRLAFWLIAMIAGTAIAQLTHAWLDRTLRLRTWQEVVVMTLAITPPISVVVWLLATILDGALPKLVALPYIVPPVLVVSACMATLHATVNRVPLQSHVHPVTQVAVPVGDAFRARLEFKYRQAEIFALSAEDHYLRVHTSAGESLILMRLYDAVRELDGIEGSQIHRSWWVAKDAVADVARGDGKVDLVLKGGLRAPVSRRYQKALKAGGWL